ncbi:MAG: glycosyltransferase family 2 protein [Proteobacteria bacterium]|nr:glycosyltransferase family 2 protein [Pseudomonadota bacterium]
MSICAVIVTYHPTKEIIDNVRALVDQVDEVVIVDNGSGSATKEFLSQLKCHTNVSVVYNQENIGIAAALNIGVKKAQVNDHQWVATFDQDSQATPRMIETMLQAYDAYPQKEKVASLSSRYKDINSGLVSGSQMVSSPSEKLPYTESWEAITSGNLVKLSIFDTIGYFNESLFIDYVDIEFGLRCLTKGYKILEIRESVLIHSIGRPIQCRFLCRMLIVRNHSALRHYYITRNTIYTYKKFANMQPIWVLNNCVYSFINTLKMLLFEDDRRKKIIATFLGFFDGLVGRMGKCRYSILK